MIWTTLQSNFLFAPNRIYVEIVKYVKTFPSGTLEFISFWRQLGSYLGVKIPGDSFLGIPPCFFWYLGINSFWRQLGSLLEFSCGNLGINSVWHQLGSPMGFSIPGDSFSGIPPCFPPVGVYSDYSFVGDYIFPRWGFIILFFSWGTTFFWKCVCCVLLPYHSYPYTHIICHPI